MMDEALVMPEISMLICQESRMPTLAALARVSKSFSELALNCLYSEVHLDEILRVLPSELWTFEEELGFSFVQPLVGVQWFEPLHRHSKRVHELTVSDEWMSGVVLTILAAASAKLPIPLFPALKKLDVSNISTLSMLTEFWSHRSLFFSQTLEHFIITTHGPPTLPMGPFIHQSTCIHQLPQYAPNIRRLSVRGFPPAPVIGQAFASAFRSWYVMETVELDSIIVTLEIMKALSALPNLRKLHVSSVIPLITLEPGLGFPALEDLYLVCPPETFSSVMKRTTTSRFHRIFWVFTPSSDPNDDLLHPLVFIPAPAMVKKLHLRCRTSAPPKSDLIGLVAMCGLTHLVISISSGHDYDNDDLSRIMRSLPLLRQFHFGFANVGPFEPDISPYKINVTVFQSVVEHLIHLKDLALPLDLPPLLLKEVKIPPPSSQVKVLKVVACTKDISWDATAFAEYLLLFFPRLEVLDRPFYLAPDPNEEWWRKVIDLLSISKHTTGGNSNDM
ncbi:hypothetical protein DL96DRAFT_1616124 [Flagelloscypha sp. PMI_526]|nr:hypothetical protein DL96DRAFT_1616124 [Flagelloscypha sp. PMI_526]